MTRDRILMDWETDPIKMLILSELIYRFNTIPNKIPAIFCRYRQIYSKIYVERYSNKTSQKKPESEK